MVKKIVVIGGGFAGSLIAKNLEKRFDITLIDTKDYFEFTPGILRTINEPDHIKKIQVMHSKYLKKAKIIIGEVSEASKEFVKVNGEKINFDYLVISSGSRYNGPIKEQNIVITTRAHHLANWSHKLFDSKKVLIVGGGLVGVELAAEISTHFKDKDVTLVHSRDKLIPRNNPKSTKYAEKFLKKHNVKLIFNTRIESKDKKTFSIGEGKSTDYDIVFLCIGIQPNFEFMKKNFKDKLDPRNSIKANDYLQLEGCTNIFVAGDITNRKEEKTAQNSELEAEFVINNICALEDGKELEMYKCKKRAFVISLGKYHGILEYKNFVLGGILPGILKSIIEKIFMYKYR